MRLPTPTSELYKWWSEALRNPAIERHEDEPHCGYFKRKMVKNGPWVPVEVYCSRVISTTGELASDEQMIAAYPDGVECDAKIIWTYLVPITSSEFRARIADYGSLATHAAVDLITQPARPK